MGHRRLLLQSDWLGLLLSGHRIPDDYSRFILAHKLQTEMTADSLIKVVKDAVDGTGMTEVPVADRTRLPSEPARATYLERSGTTLI